MKQSMKIIGLAGMLALCLMLTGCYNAPDDVNSGGTTDPGNVLPFQTLAPTATMEVTPDTVVIETQNIFGGDTSATAATPTPTQPENSGNGWSDWGTVQDGNTENPSPTPSSSVIVFDGTTPEPSEGAPTIEVVTAEPATPTPTPTTAPVTPTRLPLRWSMRSARTIITSPRWSALLTAREARSRCSCTPTVPWRREAAF